MGPTINILSVFAGGGMHDTAVHLALDALGYGVRAVGYVERDAYAAALLLARMEHATLGRAPVWCDCISRLDARPLRGWVDALIASPPCQPYSSAGKREGNADARSHGEGEGPLPHLIRVIEECDPALGWLENVPEWLTDGHFREFGEQLCRMGYDIAPPVFGTSARLGNAHKRERVFVLFYRPALVDAQRLRARQGEQGEQGEHERIIDPGDGRPQHQRGRRSDREPHAALGGGEGARLGEPSRTGREGGERAGPHGAGAAPRGPTGEPGGAFIHPLVPPGRPIFDLEMARYAGRDGTTLGAVLERIAGSAAALRQWAGLAAGGLDPTLMPAVEPGVPVVADALAASAGDLLRVGGNGVDPLVVADAFVRAWLGAGLPRGGERR